LTFNVLIFVAYYEPIFHHPERISVEMTLLFLHGTWILPLSISANAVLFGFDPLGQFFLLVWPHGAYGFGLVFVRSLATIHLTYVLWYTLALGFSLTIIALYIIQYSLFCINNWIDFHSSQIEFQCCPQSRRVKTIRKRIPSAEETFNLHRSFRVLEKFVCESYYYILQLILALGGVLLVFTNYGSIRLHSVLPFPVCTLFPLFSVTNASIVSALFPAASDAHEKSLKYLKRVGLYWATRTNKYWERRVKSERAFRFSFGPFFIAKRSTKMTFYACVFDYTLTSVLYK